MKGGCLSAEDRRAQNGAGAGGSDAYRIGEPNDLLCYVYPASTTSDYEDVASTVCLGFAIVDRVEYLSTRRRGLPNLSPLEPGLVRIVIVSICDDEMVKYAVSGAIVCTI